MLTFSWILQMILISTAIIFLVHHIIFYLKDTLTVPKVKDMVKKHHTLVFHEYMFNTLAYINNLKIIDTFD
jgi:hypothetical protein